jgi:hypothetical protein
MICSGSYPGSVHKSAWGEKRPRGSRSSTQRMGTTGIPPRRHTAVPEQNSTMRSPSPSQPDTVTRRQRVLVRISTSERFGRRAPLVRGRPLIPGRRCGAGSKRAASRSAGHPCSHGQAGPGERHCNQAGGRREWDMANLLACHVKSHLRCFEAATSRPHQDAVLVTVDDQMTKKSL